MTRSIRFFFLFIACISHSIASFATEMLSNNSFEAPLVPNNGNNFYTTIPAWTILPSLSIARPANVVKPFAGYANNPTATPAGGGLQYFDINSAGGFVTQTVSFPSQGVVSYGAWFSVRDMVQNLSNGYIRLKNPSGTVVSTATVAFTTADPIGTWKRASATNIAVSAGTYTVEIFMDNFHNIDLANVDFLATTIAVTKAAGTVVDSDGNGPDQGDTLPYSFTVKNTGDLALTNVTISDPAATISGGPIASLAAGATNTTTFTGSYILTQANFNAGQMTNQATAFGLPPFGATVSDLSDPLSLTGNAPTVTPLTPISKLQMTKSANTPGPLTVGTVVTYYYDVKNTGNQIITSVSTSDIHNGSGILPVPGNETLLYDASPTGDSADGAPVNSLWTTLAPGDTVRFSASYTVTQADIDLLQ